MCRMVLRSVCVGLMNKHKKFLSERFNLYIDKIERLHGGWRKDTYLIHSQKPKVVCILEGDCDKKKLNQALKLEEDFGGRKVLELEKYDHKWLIVFAYIDGEVKWEWGEKEARKVGRKLAEFHENNVCHFDLKPGNVIWEEEKIKAVIDFEESVRSEQDDLKIKDLANTLSWVLISGGQREVFLEGYQTGGQEIICDKLNKQLLKYLVKRVKEGNKKAFLQLAKQRLTNFRNKVSGKLLNKKKLNDFREDNKNKKIVFTVGAYELIHWGHLEFLKRAKKKGDLLVVGVGSDQSRKRLKGDSFPIVGDKTRAETLCHFDYIDGVVVVEEDDVLEELKKLQPDVFYTTEKDWDRGVRREQEKKWIDEHGKKLVKVGYSKPKVPSSKMVEKVALAKIKHVLMEKTERQPILKINGGKKNPKLIDYDNLEDLGGKLRENDERIVFTSMTADLFHLGHARFLQKAKSVGDKLVLGLPSNKSVRKLKGWGRPIVDQTARAMVLADIDYIDHIVIFDERTILGCLKKLKPDIFFTVKESWNKGLATSPEAKLMVDIGGKIVRSERQAPYISASKMIDKAAGELIKDRFFEILETARKTTVLNADFDPFAPENQLTAREKGFYDKVLEEVAERGKCVFCDLKDKYIVDEKDNVVLTAALYPYEDGHLLIIPRRHIESMDDLNNEEREAVFDLAKKGKKLLKENQDVDNFWVLVREGEGIKAGKTVDHLHFHLLPYDPEVIKMGETELSVKPIDLAKKLRNE